MKKYLPNVTLLGLESINVERCKLVTDICQKYFDFGDIKLLSSIPVSDPVQEKGDSTTPQMVLDLMIQIDKLYYKGIIIKESLEYKDVLHDVEILETEISDDGEWHMCTVLVSSDYFEKVSQNIKDGTWYAHFWKDRDVVAVFKNKIISFNFDDRSTWAEVLEYGRSLGIPEEQLDFVIS